MNVDMIEEECRQMVLYNFFIAPLLSGGQLVKVKDGMGGVG